MFILLEVVAKCNVVAKTYLVWCSSLRHICVFPGYKQCCTLAYSSCVLLQLSVWNEAGAAVSPLRIIRLQSQLPSQEIISYKRICATIIYL